MTSTLRSPAISYVVAILVVGAAAVLTRVIWPVAYPTSMGSLFLVAVAVSAWLGGMGPGLTATCASFGALAGLVVLLGDVHELRAPDVLRVVSLLPIALVIGLLYQGRTRAQQALRERDARLQLISEQIPGGLWSTDAALRITSGFGAQSALLHGPAGTTLQEHFQSRDAGFEPIAAHRRALRGESSSYELQWCGRTFQCYVEPLRGIDSEIIGVVGIATDITDRKLSEEERERLVKALEAQRAQLDQANRSKDQFLAMLSHELRTPLTPVLALATAMADRAELSAEVREDAETICRNVNLEARLIDDLLDVTRISRGKLQLHPQQVDCHDLVRNAAHICAPDAAQKGVELEIDLAAASHFVSGDAARLQQVFWNLIKNGIKFTPAGGRVIVRSFDQADDLCVEVSDTGIGIEPHVLPRVFDAFEQGAASITRQFGGLGLGLAISKALVEAHKGTISAESGGGGAGTGATFRVRLHTVTPAVAPPAPGGAGDGGARTRALRILLVEDHAETAKVMQRLLGAAGHRVETAGSVEAALRVLAADPVDLLISDVGLPDGNGVDLMREVMRRDGVKGIALSGFGTEEDVQRSLAAGFAVHLTKPVPMSTLHKAIAEAAGVGV